MTLVFRRAAFILITIFFVLTACTTQVTPTLSGAIVPTRAATGTPTQTPTVTATATATPTLTPTNTPTITPTPTRTIPSVDIGDTFSFTGNGTISVLDWQVRYTFIGNAGDSVSIEMNTTSPQLDPLLALVDFNGTRLIENDDINEASDNAAILNYIIDADGIYTIVATRRGEGDSPYIGDYQLDFLRLPANYYDAETGLALLPIELNTDQIGSIDDEAFFQSHIFTGSTGDVISITMNRASGDLDPYLVLVNRQTRQILIDNDDDVVNNTINASIEAITLPQDGEYVILATRYQGADGNSVGDFVLRISTTPE